MASIDNFLNMIKGVVKSYEDFKTTEEPENVKPEDALAQALWSLQSATFQTQTQPVIPQTDQNLWDILQWLWATQPNPYDIIPTQQVEQAPLIPESQLDQNIFGTQPIVSQPNPYDIIPTLQVEQNPLLQQDELSSTLQWLWAVQTNPYDIIPTQQVEQAPSTPTIDQNLADILQPLTQQQDVITPSISFTPIVEQKEEKWILDIFSEWISDLWSTLYSIAWIKTDQYKILSKAQEELWNTYNITSLTPSQIATIDQWVSLLGTKQAKEKFINDKLDEYVGRESDIWFWNIYQWWFALIPRYKETEYKPVSLDYWDNAISSVKQSLKTAWEKYNIPDPYQEINASLTKSQTDDIKKLWEYHSKLTDEIFSGASSRNQLEWSDYATQNYSNYVTTLSELYMKRNIMQEKWFDTEQIDWQISNVKTFLTNYPDREKEIMQALIKDKKEWTSKNIDTLFNWMWPSEFLWLGRFWQIYYSPQDTLKLESIKADENLNWQRLKNAIWEWEYQNVIWPVYNLLAWFTQQAGVLKSNLTQTPQIIIDSIWKLMWSDDTLYWRDLSLVDLLYWWDTSRLSAYTENRAFQYADPEEVWKTQSALWTIEYYSSDIAPILLDIYTAWRLWNVANISKIKNFSTTKWIWSLINSVIVNTYFNQQANVYAPTTNTTQDHFNDMIWYLFDPDVIGWSIRLWRWLSNLSKYSDDQISKIAIRNIAEKNTTSRILDTVVDGIEPTADDVTKIFYEEMENARKWKLKLEDMEIAKRRVEATKTVIKDIVDANPAVWNALLKNTVANEIIKKEVQSRTVWETILDKLVWLSTRSDQWALIELSDLSKQLSALSNNQNINVSDMIQKLYGIQTPQYWFWFAWRYGITWNVTDDISEFVQNIKYVWSDDLYNRVDEVKVDNIDEAYLKKIFWQEKDQIQQSFYKQNTDWNYSITKEWMDNLWITENYKPIDNTLYKRDLAVDWKTSVAKIEKQDIQYNNTPFFNDKQWLKEAIESWSAQYNITKIVKSIYNC